MLRLYIYILWHWVILINLICIGDYSSFNLFSMNYSLLISLRAFEKLIGQQSLTLAVYVAPV